MIFHLYRHQNPLGDFGCPMELTGCGPFFWFHLSDLLRKIDRVSYGLLGKKQLEAGNLWIHQKRHLHLRKLTPS